MLILFGSAKLLAELFERLGQPGIIGEILAGVLVGPSVLGWIQPDHFTHTMAGLGVLFLLFRVGLEVDADALLQLGRTAVIVGVLGVVVPFACGYAFYTLAGKDNLESIFLGTALTATSVGITAQVLAAKKLLHRTAAKIILGAAVVDDILALLLLGFVGSVARGSVDAVEIAATTLLALGFIAVVARWGASVIGRIAGWLGSRMQSGESEFAVALILLFSLAALSETIGVAAIVGAFLAGMAISKSVPHRVHEFSAGVAELLVPFFLAEIGLHFQLQVFQDSRIVLLALLLVPIAVFSKIVGGGLGSLSHGRTIALRVGAGMVPRGEFCMVVAQTGLALGALKSDSYALIVFMAVASATLAPPLLKWTFRDVANEAEDHSPLAVVEPGNLW